MKRGILWIIALALTNLVVILASCAPAAPTTPTTPTTLTTLTTPTPAPIPAPPKPTSEEPIYGGSLTQLMPNLSRGFDPYRAANFSFNNYGTLVLETLGIGDRTKGPGGTNEYGFVLPQPDLVYSKGALAESWEVSPDGLAVTFHIRKGVHFHNKPPVNGRELTANDVKYCFDRLLGIGSGFTEPTPYNLQVGNP